MSTAPAQQALTETIAPQVIDDLPFDEYLALDAMSSTELRKWLDSIADGLHYREHGVDDSKSLRLGRLFHCCVLEPERWQKEHVELKPPVDVGGMYHLRRKTARRLADGETIDEIAAALDTKRKTVAGYTKRDDVQMLAGFYGEHGTDFEPTDESEIEQVERMRDALFAHPIVEAGMLTGGRAEVSFVWHKDGITGKCRADYLVDIGGAWLVVDLKGTSSGADTDSFQRTLLNWRYDVQGAWYADGIEAATGKPVEHFVFAAVEFNEPHNVGLHECDPMVLECGRWGTDRRPGYETALERIKAHRDDPSIYTGYSPEIETLTLPAWA